MKASVIDLRNKMSQIIKALDRNENVTIIYHGKEKGIIVPIKKTNKMNAKDHPLFGSLKNDAESVENIMNRLRGNRFNDI